MFKYVILVMVNNAEVLRRCRTSYVLTNEQRYRMDMYHRVVIVDT